MTANLKVMVLSAGSGVGYGVIAAVRMASRPFVIAGLNAVLPAAGVFECDEAYLTPVTAEPDRFLKRLYEVLDRVRPALVVPGRDADVPILAAAKPHLEQLGALALTGTPEAAAMSTDKGRQAEELGAAGLPFARTVTGAEAAEGLARDTGYPLIAKPRFGHSSIGVRVIGNRQELEAALTTDADLIYQEYLMPDEWRDDRRPYVAGRLRQEDEYSIQLLIGRRGELLGSFASRNRLEQGVPMVIEVVRDQPIETLIENAARVLGEIGVRGPCNLQARRVNDRYILFEVNARFTGLTPVRTRMGYREVEAAFCHFVEGSSPRSLLRFDQRQMAVRYLTESVFSCDAFDELKRSGTWRASS